MMRKQFMNAKDAVKKICDAVNGEFYELSGGAVECRIYAYDNKITMNAENSTIRVFSNDTAMSINGINMCDIIVNRDIDSGKFEINCLDKDGDEIMDVLYKKRNGILRISSGKDGVASTITVTI